MTLLHLHRCILALYLFEIRRNSQRSLVVNDRLAPLTGVIEVFMFFAAAQTTCSNVETKERRDKEHETGAAVLDFQLCLSMVTAVPAIRHK